MGNHKIDRLFREKSEAFEVQPNEEAWKAIASQVHTKGTGYLVYWKVAAAVLVMLGVGFWLFQVGQKVPGEMMISGDFPQEETQFTLPDVPGVLVADLQIEKEETVQSLKQTRSEPGTHVLPSRTLPHGISPIGTRDLIKRDNITQLPDLAKVKETSQTKVVIRYYAHTPDSSNVKGKKGLGQLLAKAQTFRPGELLADLRAAKDDLLSSKRN